MLTALRDCLELVEAHHGQRWRLHSIPQEDPGVYDMLCEADTVGVFQVESARPDGYPARGCGRGGSTTWSSRSR